MRRNEPNIFSLSQGDTLVVIRQVPQVLFVANVLHSWILKRPRYFWSVVRRAVVHDQHFEVLMGLGKNGSNAFGEQMSTLVARDYEADSRFEHRNEPTLVNKNISRPVVRSVASLFSLLHMFSFSDKPFSGFMVNAEMRAEEFMPHVKRAANLGAKELLKLPVPHNHVHSVEVSYQFERRQ